MNQLAVKYGFRTLCCEVNEKPPNPGSLRFHQRQGFKVFKVVEHDPTYVVNFMVKNIGKTKQKTDNLNKPSDTTEKPQP